MRRTRGAARAVALLAMLVSGGAAAVGVSRLAADAARPLAIELARGEPEVAPALERQEAPEPASCPLVGPEPAEEGADPAAEDRKICTAAELYQLLAVGYGRSGRPIAVARAALSKPGQPPVELLLVTSQGLQSLPCQATGLVTALRAGLGLQNGLVRALRATVQAHAEPGLPVYLVGHSLGGMSVQLLSTDRQLAQRNPIEAVLTYGAPLIGVTPLGWDQRRSRSGVVRLTDACDPVQLLSAQTVSPNFLRQLGGARRAWSGSCLDPVRAHIAYGEPPWDRYDVTGAPVARGAEPACLTLRGPVLRFPAPSR